MVLKQVKATLSVIEDERNRFLAKLLEEGKTRQTLEGERTTAQLFIQSFVSVNAIDVTLLNLTFDPPEQIQKLEHARSALENDKGQLESQQKTLEQKLEIMSEMYQQKENALHQ